MEEARIEARPAGKTSCQPRINLASNLSPYGMTTCFKKKFILHKQLTDPIEAFNVFMFTFKDFFINVLLLNIFHDL